MLPRRAGRSLFLAAAVFAGTALLAFSGSASGETAAAGPRNVLGQELGICSTSPMTGFFRWVCWAGAPLGAAGARMPVCHAVHA